MNDMHSSLLPTKRVVEIDQMKGITILLVVISHMGSSPMLAPIDGLISLFRMPLFFFLSGFVLKKVALPVSAFPSFVKKKFCRLLLPCLSMGTLFAYIVKNEDFCAFIDHRYKMGYWYLWVLFIYCIIIFFYNRLSSRFCHNKIWLDMLLAVLVSISFIGIATLIHIVGSPAVEHFISYASCLEKASTYILPFMLGVLYGKYSCLADLMFRDQRIFIMSLLIVLILGYCELFHRVSVDGSYILFAVKYIRHLIFAIAAINCMGYIFFTALPKSGFIMDKLAYIGTKTLDIYVIHYFVRASIGLTSIRVFVEGIGSVIVELVINILLAILVIIVSIAIGHIIRKSKLLGFVLLGAN